MIKESFKTISITSLCLKDKDLSNLSIEEIVSIYEETHEKVLEILNSQEQLRKIKTIPKSELGL